jgi:RNA polymerase sigma factor (sigma-70 family)
MLHYLRGLFRAPAGAPTDRELLHAFAARRDEAAFAALVERHGALVWGTCRRLLRQEQDAEDAFQATFLVLAKKAGAIPWREDAGNWLYAVALRVAAKVRARAGRQRRLESEVVMRSRTEPDGAPDGETSGIVVEEVGRLPEKYRRPMVLCVLQGKTQGEAARLLGWPEGTVSGRLARARELLRGRLVRRGVAPPAAGVATLFAASASEAAVPAGLAQVTIRSALTFAAGPGLRSAAAALAQEVLRAMFLSKLRFAAAGLAVLVLLGTGVGLWARARDEPRGPVAEGPPVEWPKEAANALPPQAWAGRWAANPFADAESIEVRHHQLGTGVARVYHITDAKAVAAVVRAARITAIRNDMFVGCIPTGSLIVHGRDGSVFRASFAGGATLSCDTGLFTVDEGLITALGRAVSAGTAEPVDLLERLPAPPGTFVKPTPPPSPKSLTTGFTSLEVTFALGDHLHRTRITDEQTLDALAKTLLVTWVEPLGKEPVVVRGLNVVCKDQSVFRFQFLTRETFWENDVGKLTVTPAFVEALNKEVSRRTGCDIDVAGDANPLPEPLRRRSGEFRRLLDDARSLRYTEKRDGQEETVLVDEPTELAEIVRRLAWVEAAPRDLPLAKWDRVLELTTKAGRTLTILFLHPGKNSEDAESMAAMPFLSDLIEVPGLGQLWIDNQWHGRFADLARERVRKAKERRDVETSRLVCRDLPAFRKLVVSVRARYPQGKHLMEGVLPAEEAEAVLALLAAGRFEPLDWTEERWDRELTDLYKRDAGEFDLTPGLGYDLLLLVSGEREMLVPMCGKLTFAESPLPKLRKTMGANEADAVRLLPGPKP